VTGSDSVETRSNGPDRYGHDIRMLYRSRMIEIFDAVTIE